MAKTTKMPAKFADAEEMLHQAAVAQVGLDDFGEKDYLTGLRVLLKSIDSDLELSEAGRERVFATVLRALSGRLYSQKGWAEHPECLRTEIRAPLVIVGLPRTGTTTLQKLMSLDPQFQGLEYWLAPNPMVRPPREEWESNPLYRSAAAALEAADREDPMSRLIHDVVAGEPDECLYMMLQRFVHNTFGASLGTPGYDEWWMAQDETPNYYRHRDNLKLIGFNEPDKRWLLRNISHLLYLDSLLEVFPDAKHYTYASRSGGGAALGVQSDHDRTGGRLWDRRPIHTSAAGASSSYGGSALSARSRCAIAILNVFWTYISATSWMIRWARCAAFTNALDSSWMRRLSAGCKHGSTRMPIRVRVFINIRRNSLD